MSRLLRLRLNKNLFIHPCQPLTLITIANFIKPRFYASAAGQSLQLTIFLSKCKSIYHQRVFMFTVKLRRCHSPSLVAYRKEVMLLSLAFVTHSVRKNVCLSRTFGVARKLRRNHFYAAFPSL